MNCMACTTRFCLRSVLARSAFEGSDMDLSIEIPTSDRSLCPTQSSMRLAEAGRCYNKKSQGKTVSGSERCGRSSANHRTCLEMARRERRVKASEADSFHVCTNFLSWGRPWRWLPTRSKASLRQSHVRWKPVSGHGRSNLHVLLSLDPRWRIQYGTQVNLHMKPQPGRQSQMPRCLSCLQFCQPATAWPMSSHAIVFDPNTSARTQTCSIRLQIPPAFL